MCGVAGFIDFSDRSNSGEAYIHAMLEKVIHRGPDSSGIFSAPGVVLGFRRLSIVDLNHGDQPLKNEDGSVVVVCNGEIFNHRELRASLRQRGHRFQTGSDIETIVHLYEEQGVQCFAQLNGQFACALFDRNKERLFLVRDPSGIAPLYYAKRAKTVLFASEIKALLAHPTVAPEIDLIGLDQVFNFPGVMSPRTLFKDVQSLEHGSYLEISPEGTALHRYWDLNYPKTEEASDGRLDRFYVEELQQRLFEAVRLRSQADVEVGYYLSGGLDSSLVGAILAELDTGSSYQAFSVQFSETKIDESRYQVIAAERSRSRLRPVQVDAEAIHCSLRRMVYHAESPVKESYNTCALALSGEAHRNGIKAVLGGQGADEIFAGYPGYKYDQLGATRHRPASPFESELRHSTWGSSEIFFERDLVPLYNRNVEFYAEGVRDTYETFSSLRHQVLNPERVLGRDPIHQRSYLDFKLRLTDHLLIEHGDKMNLANSVEGRFPFLDREVLAFATAIPSHLKIRKLVEKYILKKIALPFVPMEIIKREKFGFRAPNSAWLLNHRIAWVWDALSPAQIRRQGYFDPSAIQQLVERYTAPGFRLDPHYEDDLLMVVLTFGLLLEEFAVPAFR